MPDVLTPETIESPADQAGDNLIEPSPLTETEATRLLNKLLSFDEQEARLEAQYKAMKAELQRDRENTESYALPALRAYYQANPPKKGKMVKLLTGSMGFRTVKGGARIRDEETVREWAMQEMPEAVTPRTVFDLDKDAIRKHALASGEVVPGVELVADEDRFYVKGAKGGDE